jgi:hypothetical protein
MKRAECLYYKNFKIDSNTIQFVYEADGSSFIHRLNLSTEPSLNKKFLENVLKDLGMCFLLDISQVIYPRKIRLEFPYTVDRLDFWKSIYPQIAVEKLYINKSDMPLLESNWELTKNEKIKTFKINKRRKKLLCVSGGKDSLAALKTFEGKITFDLLFLEPKSNLFRFQAYEVLKNYFRTISAHSEYYKFIRLFEKKYGSRIQSWFDVGQLIFLGLLFSDRYDSIWLANEYSANFGNDFYRGIEVNHQYTKSLKFAQKINKYIHQYHTPDFVYDSPFFGLYDFKVMDLFLSDSKYLYLWTSCNWADSKNNFCGFCYKCAFTYLTALAFSDKIFLRNFFPYDLLENEKLFEPLINPQSIKPLECIGEKKEVWVALALIYQAGKDTASKTMKYFLRIYPLIEKKLNEYYEEINSLQNINTNQNSRIRKILLEKL